MSIEINYIPGNKQSASVNDAYSIVLSAEGETPYMLGIVPVEQVEGKALGEITDAFARAVAGERDEIVQDVIVAASEKFSAPQPT